MKLISIKTTFITAVFALIITLIACNSDSLLKDVNIEIGTQLLYNPINLQVLDARMNGSLPANATVTITGKDKDKIFSVFGEKALTINSEGMINIGIPRTYKPTVAAPLEFMIIINAPGFLEGRKSIMIGDVTKLRLEEVRMVNLAAPPKGVSIQSNIVIPVNTTTGVVQDLAFSTPTIAGKTEDATVKLTSGTKMFDKDGVAVTGDVKVTLVHFDAVNESSISSFPGGLSFNNALDKDGNTLGSGVFTTFGFIAMNMTANGKEVKTFSKPLDMEIDVNPNTYRPLLGRNVRVGDTLPIWSLNESSATWNAETKAVVVNQNGKLKAIFKQQHLSWWNIDDPSCLNMLWSFPSSPTAICQTCSNPQISILSDFPANGNKNYLYADISAPNNPAAHVWNMQGDYTNFANGTTIPFSNFLGGNATNTDLGLVFKIYDKSPSNGGQLLFTSATLFPCQNAVLDLRGKLPKDLTDPTKVPIINLNFSGICAGSTANDPNAIIKPTVTIYFQEVDVDVTWRVLGQVVNGVGSTTGLIPGRKYKFGVFHGSLSRTTDDIGLKDGFLMPNGDAVIAVKSTAWGVDETFNIKKEGNAYNLNYINFPISDKLCKEYKKFF